MIIVSGTLTVDPADRDRYLAGCIPAIEAARRADGCVDYALSSDLVVPGRINVYELWRSREDLQRFRGDGPADDQLAALRAVDVVEFNAERAHLAI
ncbi:MAG: putative quinol monooxygenase [Nocardioides sp.]